MSSMTSRRHREVLDRMGAAEAEVLQRPGVQSAAAAALSRLKRTTTQNSEADDPPVTTLAPAPVRLSR